jgi:hypothetical protein
VRARDGCIYAGGFRVPRSAVARAEELDLGRMRPAVGLYRLALDYGTVRQVADARANTAALAWIHSWLGAEVGVEAARVVETGGRIVQEHVGMELLADSELCALLEDASSVRALGGGFFPCRKDHDNRRSS